jgi:hypothetical protein
VTEQLDEQAPTLACGIAEEVFQWHVEHSTRQDLMLVQIHTPQVDRCAA